MGRPRKPTPSNAEELRGDYVGPREAAAILGVSVSTVHKMVEAGSLEAWKTQGGHRRISSEAIQKMAHKARAPFTRAAGKKLRILLVEDNPVILKSYSKVFSQWASALEILQARDGGEALLQVAQSSPDILITDLAMQPVDGFYLIRMLRSNREFAQLRIVAISGLTQEQINARGPLDPSVIVYRKPVSLERLAGYIEAQLQMHGLTR